MAAVWAKLPTWWIVEGIENTFLMSKDPGLRRFTQWSRGVSIAALKLYIALIMRTDNDSKSDKYGSVAISLAELNNSTGMSRAMLVKGAVFLEGLGIIGKDSGKGARNIYHISGYSKTPWGKLPKNRFTRIYADGKTLIDIPLRGKANLNALKLYLFLASSIDRKTGAACRKYDTIEHETGIRRNDIRAAISILINNQLVKVEHEKMLDGSNPYESPNYYFICGLENKEEHGGAM